MQLELTNCAADNSGGRLFEAYCNDHYVVAALVALIRRLRPSRNEGVAAVVTVGLAVTLLQL